MSETPLSACKKAPLQRILQNLNKPDGEDLEDIDEDATLDHLLAKESDLAKKWPAKNFRSQSNNKEDDSLDEHLKEDELDLTDMDKSYTENNVEVGKTHAVRKKSPAKEKKAVNATAEKRPKKAQEIVTMMLWPKV